MLAGQGGALASHGSRTQLTCALARRSATGWSYGASSGRSARRVAAPAVRVCAAAGRAWAAAPGAAPTGATHSRAATRPCAALPTAAAAETEPEPARRGRPRKIAAGEAAQAEPQKRRQKRAPKVGKTGEKTADGKPKPDERTVADLVERGWFESEEAAVTLLTRGKTGVNRYAFETARPAADWLEATLGRVLLKGGVLPAAKLVQRFPDLLYQDAALLQRKWDALTLSAEQGGAGVAFSEEQAREVVLKHPNVLGYATDTLKRGWLMLTATEGGLGLSPEGACSCILLSPNVLLYDHDAVVRRVELLKSLGFPQAYKMVLDQSRVLNFKDETVRDHAAWWKLSGLDHLKIVESYPLLLGVSTTGLQEKLSFLRDVAGLSTDDLKLAAPILASSLDKKLRPRFFYAWKHGALERNKLSTLSFCSVATYLRKVHQLDAPADDDAVDLYKETIASADFQAWAAQEEARRRGAAAAAKVSHGS